MSIIVYNIIYSNQPLYLFFFIVNHLFIVNPSNRISLEDGWWRGYLKQDPTKDIKIFPSNYVERVTEPKPKATVPSREKRLNQMKRQSIFAPPESKGASQNGINHSTINPTINKGGTRHRKGGPSLGVSIDGPPGQTEAEAQKALQNAKSHQKLTKRSAQSHTLRYSVFAHNLAAVSALLLLILSPIAMLWGTECLLMSLDEGILGVMIVNGLPRVRINSDASKIAAVSAGVSSKYMITVPSACQGDTDFWIGSIGFILSVLILFVLEPCFGNRRNEKSLPWRCVLYFIMGIASIGSAPTVIPGFGLLVTAAFHGIAASKGEHGNANPQPRGKKPTKKKDSKSSSSFILPVYYFPTILRCGLCGRARGLWDGRNNKDHDDNDSNSTDTCCTPFKTWFQMECAEKSNLGKWGILFLYFLINAILFFQRFNLMIESGLLIDTETLKNVTNPKVFGLVDCDPERTPLITDWSTFACPTNGMSPPPTSDVRAYCEKQLSEQAESSFESVHIGALEGRNIQPNPIQRGDATGMAWIVVHSPTSISFRLEAQGLTGPPIAVHFHGPANALGVQVGPNPLPSQGATGGILLPIYATKEYLGNVLLKDDVLGERSEACPVVGSAGEEIRCERLRMTVSNNVTEYLKRGRVYVNIHTITHPLGEIRANLRETFVSILDSPNRNVKTDEEEDAKGLDPPEIVGLKQGQGVATIYLLDDGVDKIRLPSIDHSILIGNLLPDASGTPNKMTIVKTQTATKPTTVPTTPTTPTASPTTDSIQPELLQYLCSNTLPFGMTIVQAAGIRKCSIGINAGCYGNEPPTNVLDGTIVLAGGGTAAKTINQGICGPFTPVPLRNSKTPTGMRTNVGGGAVYDLRTNPIETGNETVRAMRTRRSKLIVESSISGDIIVSGTIRSAVAIAYALPPLALTPTKLSGTFQALPGTSPPSTSPFIPTNDPSLGISKIAPSTAAGTVSIRLIDPRSFAYVLELYELSGVPTHGIFIRGPGLRARTRSSQLVIHTIASKMIGNGTAAIRAATQECELVSASLTVCAGTVRNIDEAMISSLLNGQLYIDVRTTRYPYGELRAVINEKISDQQTSASSSSFTSTSTQSTSSSIAMANGINGLIFSSESNNLQNMKCGSPLARHLGLSYGGAWAKAFGQCLNFNCGLILIPILRYLLRKVNNIGNQSGKKGGLSAWVPFHLNIDFHKLIAFVIAICTAGHVVAHFLNYSHAPDATVTRFHWHAWLTGALITFSMLFIFSGGQVNVKRAHYELFINTHKIFAIIFFICLLLHGPGPVFWVPGLLGIGLYILENILRQYRGSQHFFVRSVHYVPPVMQLKFRPRHPDEFHFMEGQYLYLNCPYISQNEWHPFTISSAIGDLDQGGDEGWVSVHIRIIPGGWTEKFLRYFLAMSGRDINEDDLKKEMFLSLTSRDAKGAIQIGKDRGVDGKPLLLVDGPHAAPAQHYSTYDHVMMIGAGIGLTPSCSVLRSVLKYKWKKGWKPSLLRFYWVVRHSEIDSFLWFLEQLIQLEKEIVADRASGTIRNIHIFEANIYITRAPKNVGEIKTSERVSKLLLNFKTDGKKRRNSMTRGLAPSPMAQKKKDHVGIDMLNGGSGGKHKTTNQKMQKNMKSVASVAGLGETVDIGYDMDTLYRTMNNPTISSKQQTASQLAGNAEYDGGMNENRLGSVWIWNGRPDWNQIFDQNANTPYVTTGIGVAFCGTPFIGKDLAKYCRIKSNAETGRVFHLLKENF